MRADHTALTVSLQLCTQEHLPTLQKIAVQSYREHYLYLWTDERYAQWYIDKSFGTESLQQQLSHPHSLFFLILYQHYPVGFIKLNLHHALAGDAPADSMELERIYLLKAAGGKGIGTAAVQEVIAMAKRWRKKVLWLKSMDSSPAVGFYQQCGFSIAGVERLPFEGFKDEYRNLFIMRLLLDDAAQTA